MEYIKKEELIKGEVYRVEDGNFWMIGIVTLPNNGGNDGGSKRGNATYITSVKEVKVDQSWAYQSNYGRTYRLATSEEKHWLLECIKLNKFITFEEAMKTFIPEYVECLMVTTASMHSKYQGILPILNKIYEVAKRSFPEKGAQELAVITKCGVTMYDKYTKLSTKEDYDAQFIVKEPAENKTELEIWLENTKSLNLSLEDLEKYIGSSQTCNFSNIYMKLEGNRLKESVKILFDKWNEKVIEPLPQFKVIETIETITKVENNEGNQFFIGDVVISSNGIIQTIESFDYNKPKTNIIAFTNKQSVLGIGIDKIEHYIEPKVEETLLEKAKRLYPVGTKFINPNGNKECVIKEKGDYFKGNNNNIYHSLKSGIYKYDEGLSGCIYMNNTWSKIIE